MIRRKQGSLAFLANSWPPKNNLPTLVFIHSSAVSAGMWDEQIKGLADIANTIALDLPGHGESDPPGLKTMPAYAKAVHDFITELKLPRPIPCGLSIGGGIVLQLLLDYPESAVAGILLGTGGRLRVAPAIFAEIENNYAGFPQFMEKFAFSPTASRECIEKINKLMSACPPEVAAGDFHACNSFDVMDRLKEIEQPLLIVSGADDRLTPAKYADFLAGEIRNTTRVHLENAGHMMPNEQPEKVNAAIRAFLAELHFS